MAKLHWAYDATPIDLENLPRARFFSRVRDASSGCLEWYGTRNNKGYGVIQAAGQRLLAHRVAWAIEHNEDPGEKLVLHKCDNPRCVRADHLYLGTFKDNAMDCKVRGRLGSKRKPWVWREP